MLALSSLFLGSTIPVTNAVQNVKKYASCKALKKSYPKGVAVNKRAAKASWSKVMRKPPVKRKLYKQNIHLDKDRLGYVCVRPRATKPAPEVVAPLLQPPPTVANLMVVADTPTRQDTRAIFSISWQIPLAAATNINDFSVRLSNGEVATVNKWSGLATTPEVMTYTKKAYGLFDSSVTISVAANGPGGQGGWNVVPFRTPPEPKRTITVEITVSTIDTAGIDCHRGWTNDFCYARVWDQKYLLEIPSTLTYEAPPRSLVIVETRRSTLGTSTCTIKFDGVVAFTLTDQTAYTRCYATTPS